MLRAGRSSPPPRSYAGRNPNPCKLLQGRVPGTRVASETEAVGIGSSAAFTGHRRAWRITRVCPENLGCSQQPRVTAAFPVTLRIAKPARMAEKSTLHAQKHPPRADLLLLPHAQAKLPSRQLQPHTSPDPPGTSHGATETPQHRTGHGRPLPPTPRRSPPPLKAPLPPAPRSREHPWSKRSSGGPGEAGGTAGTTHRTR